MWSAIAGAVSGGAQAGLSYAVQKKLMKMQQKHQERMYKHRHQWQVSDLRAAGLNPILSADQGTGAMPGQGATPSIQGMDLAGSVERATSAEEKGKGAKLKDKQRDLADAQIGESNARTAAAQADQRLKDAGAAEAGARAKRQLLYHAKEIEDPVLGRLNARNHPDTLQNVAAGADLLTDALKPDPATGPKAGRPGYSAGRPRPKAKGTIPKKQKRRGARGRTTKTGR